MHHGNVFRKIKISTTVFENLFTWTDEIKDLKTNTQISIGFFTFSGMCGLWRDLIQGKRLILAYHGRNEHFHNKMVKMMIQ